MPPLDLVLPCYNPAPGWVASIIQNVTQLQQLLPGTDLFIYLVNDGSERGICPQDIQTLRASLPHFSYLPNAENRGKGFALRQGVRAGKHPFCIYTDVDFPYYPESLAAVYAALQENRADVVAGVRNADYYQNVPGIRVVLSKLLQLFNRWFLHLPFTDTQCGLKGFNRAGRSLFLATRLDRYLFDLEFIFRAGKNTAIRVRPVAVSLRPGIQFRPMHPGLWVAEGRSLLKQLF